MHDDRLFVRQSRGRVTVHLHVTACEGSFWQEKLLFRDWLRAHAETAEQYASLKRTLAPQFTDGPSYSTAKTGFIRTVLARARHAGEADCLPEKMQTADEVGVVVLRDAAGALYAVPLGVVTSYRVPAEQRPEIERRLAAFEEVRGYGHEQHEAVTLIRGVAGAPAFANWLATISLPRGILPAGPAALQPPA